LKMISRSTIQFAPSKNRSNDSTARQIYRLATSLNKKYFEAFQLTTFEPISIVIGANI